MPICATSPRPRSSGSAPSFGSAKCLTLLHKLPKKSEFFNCPQAPNGRKWPRKGQPHQRAALGGQLKPIGLYKIARDGGFLWISSSLLLYRNTSHRRPTSLAVGVPGKGRLEAGSNSPVIIAN